jgi:NADH:ubiquinone oxidoreductase subunit F (NADH-binding)
MAQSHGDPSAPVDTVPNALALGAFPGFEPRLVRCDIEREDFEAYRANGGYAPGRSGDALIAAVESSGLRGRGGAAFPAGVKLRSVAARDAPRFVLANGEEGEPASVKDRWLLRVRPHLVIDGLDRVAEAIGADRSYIYVSDPEAAASVAAALEELDADGPAPRELVTTQPRYVAGEETAAVRAINGGPALPLAKPPRPFESGVGGRPTLVANVETLANVPRIATLGPREFRELGTERSPGTFLLTLSGACTRPGLYELPFGVSIREALAALDGQEGDPIGFLMGGFFAGLLGPRGLDARLAYDDLRDDGSGLGCGAIIVLGSGDCPVAAATDVMDYFDHQNAKQCGACIRGTTAMRDALLALAGGSADAARVERLQGWSMSLRERGACALLDGAAGVAGSLLREFPAEVASHLDRPCSLCAELSADTTHASSRFALSLRGGFQ